MALREMPINTRLVRFHSPGYPVTSFNPNRDPTGLVRNMDRPEGGARFNPFPDVGGSNVPTLYAGTTEHAAALESVFHDVPHVPDPLFPTSKLGRFVLSSFSVTCPLLVLDLINPQLRQVPVPGREDSLREDEIVHCSPVHYPATRRWAQFFHRSSPSLQGLAWRPRLGGEGTSYVLFGDRVATADLKPEGSSLRIDIDDGYALVDRIATSAHIKLVRTGI